MTVMPNFSRLHVGLFHVHPAVRQVARQPELLPAEVRRLLHVRHGQEQGKKGKEEAQGYAKKLALGAGILI